MKFDFPTQFEIGDIAWIAKFNQQFTEVVSISNVTITGFMLFYSRKSKPSVLYTINDDSCICKDILFKTYEECSAYCVKTLEPYTGETK